MKAKRTVQRKRNQVLGERMGTRVPLDRSGEEDPAWKSAYLSGYLDALAWVLLGGES